MRVVRVVVGAVLVLTGGVLAPGGAEAQEDAATISVEEIHPAGESVHYVVELTAADGEPIDGATVTARPTSPEGTVGTTATLSADGDGVYQGPVEMPTSGTWTVLFEATDPAAELERRQEVPVPGDEAEQDHGSNVPMLLFMAGFTAVSGVGLWLWERSRDRRGQPHAG